MAHVFRLAGFDQLRLRPLRPFAISPFAISQFSLSMALPPPALPAASGNPPDGTAAPSTTAFRPPENARLQTPPRPRSGAPRAADSHTGEDASALGAQAVKPAPKIRERALEGRHRKLAWHLSSSIRTRLRRLHTAASHRGSTPAPSPALPACRPPSQTRSNPAAFRSGAVEHPGPVPNAR